MTKELEVSDHIPAFKAEDQNGRVVSDKDFLGAPWVLYFYPKDNTPGCTDQACSFQKEIDEFRQKGIPIVGVSPDTKESHKKFAEKNGLHFTLLADPDKSLCKLFQVLKEKNMYGKKVLGVERTTFIIDKDGFINWIERKVSVQDHEKRVLNHLS